jgi:hypothetical protein
MSGRSLGRFLLLIGVTLGDTSLVEIRSKRWRPYHSGLVFGILGTAIGIAIGWVPAALLSFVLALSIGDIYVAFFVLLLVPIAVTLFIGIKVHDFHSDPSHDFVEGVLQASVGTVLILSLSAVGWKGHQDATHHEAARMARVQLEDEAVRYHALLRGYSALEALNPPLTSAVEQALRVRVKDSDMTPDMMRLVLRKFPDVSCDLATNPIVPGDVLASIYELKRCDVGIILKNPNVSDKTLQDIQESDSKWISAAARVALAQRSCDVGLLREDGAWAAEQKGQTRENMELALAKNPCSPMSAFENNEDFRRKNTEVQTAFAQRTFPNITPEARVYGGMTMEPRYIVTNEDEVLDKMGIEFLAARSCDPRFLSFLIRREAGPVDHTDDPVLYRGWIFSGLDYMLLKNVCTPEEIFQRIVHANERGTTIGGLVQLQREREKARLDPKIAKVQDWKDPECLVRKNGICKKYSSKLHLPKGFKDIGPGYVDP